MSIVKLQAVRDQVLSANIGLYLPTVKTLINAINEHIGEDNAGVAPVDTASLAKAADLAEQLVVAHEQITDLQAQLAEAQKLQSVQVEQSVIEDAVKYEQEHGIEPASGK